MVSITKQKGICWGRTYMDLSKAFDAINHELLLAKLNAYGSDKNALETLRNYLSNRWQRTKINTTLSSWSTLLKGVPQSSVLGPILLNIFLNDLSFVLKGTDACNFADDNLSYVCGISLDELLMRLEHDSTLAVCWFESNYMKLNTDNCHLIISCSKHESHHISFSVHDKNIEQLALEIYKVTKNFAPTAISSLFLQCSNNRHTRSQSDFSNPQVNTIYFGQNSIRYLGPLMWNSISTALRNFELFVEFKSLIKN